MEFKDVLNRYMERTGCSARDLAERSGLSTATISRYRSGDRVPEADSRQLENLAKGIAAIAAENSGDGRGSGSAGALRAGTGAWYRDRKTQIEF